jgi:hypothetical protein
VFVTGEQTEFTWSMTARRREGKIEQQGERPSTPSLTLLCSRTLPNYLMASRQEEGRGVQLAYDISSAIGKPEPRFGSLCSLCGSFR